MAKKKVYKNYLQREQYERKNARRKEMGKSQKAKGPNKSEVEFAKLMGMSDTEIANRLEEIKTRRENIYKEIKGRYDRVKEGNEEGHKEAFDSLMKEDKRLEKEAKKLEKFPEVKNQITKIMAFRDRSIQNKQIRLEKAKSELKEAKNELTNVKARAQEITRELKALDEYSKAFSRKQEITDDDRQENLQNAKRYNALLKEKSELTSEKEINDKIAEADAKVKLYTTGKSREDAIINKCNMAWKMLLAGKSWDEISLKAIEDVKTKEAEEKANTEQKNPNEQSEEQKPEQYQERQDQDKDKTGSVQAEIAKRVNSYMGREDEGEAEGEPPAVIKKFADKHPRLAKIPFLATIVDRINERRLERQQEQREEEGEQQQGDNKQKEKTERDLFIEYLREAVGDGHKEQGKYTTVEPKQKEEKPVEKVAKEEPEEEGPEL